MANADTNKKEKLATELVLSGADWFPLGGQDAPDPLRLVLGQLADLADDEQALVQARWPVAALYGKVSLTTWSSRRSAYRPARELARSHAERRCSQASRVPSGTRCLARCR
jgi:hypothetical protein